jgi:hypothetical protein
VDLERGPLSLVNTIEELLGRKNSGSGLETREYGRRNPSRWSRGNLSPQKLALNFADKRSLGRYSSFVDSGHRVCLFCLLFKNSVSTIFLHRNVGHQQVNYTHLRVQIKAEHDGSGDKASASSKCHILSENIYAVLTNDLDDLPRSLQQVLG